MTQKPNIPVYEHLYGELESPRQLDELHCERLEQRSGFHDWKIKPHRHDRLDQFFAVLTGGGEAIVDGKSLSFVAPYVIYVPSLTVHSFKYIANSSGFVLSAFKDEVSACLNDAPELSAIFSRPLAVSREDNENILDAVFRPFNLFHQEYRTNKPGRLLSLRSLLSIIIVNLSRSVSEQDENASAANNSDRLKVNALIEIIERHYAENHNTEFYAKAMNTSLPKLRQLTQSILGVSAHQLINNKILLEAKRNILYTSMTASQISDMLGFKDPAYFSRFFKKHTGESPSEYRKRA